jgi:predicted ATPase with chaperone activity
MIWRLSNCTFSSIRGKLFSKIEVSKFNVDGDDAAQLIGAGIGTAQCHRTQSVKLARTIADLAGCEEIQSVHLAGALQYRPKSMID